MRFPPLVCFLVVHSICCEVCAAADTAQGRGSGIAGASPSTEQTLYEFGDLIAAEKETSFRRDTLLSTTEPPSSLFSSETAVSPQLKGRGVHRTGGRLTLPGPITSFLRSTGRLMVLILLIISTGGSLWIAVALVRRRSERGRFLTTTRLSVMNKEVQRACRYIENHYADADMTVKSICEAIITGEAFLEALFERELGMGVADFIDQVRINRAKAQFRQQPDISTEELIRSNGYADTTAFFTAFRKVTGVPFSEFRLSVISPPSESA